MNKKMFITIFVIFAVLTLNCSFGHEIANETVCDIDDSTCYEDVLSADDVCENLQSNGLNSHITVESNTTFDVVGDYFKVKLADENNNPIQNSKIVFTINGNDYSKNTDSLGVASLQLNLIDGEYSIISNFDGNSKYKSSSLTTKVVINNTRIVGEDLSNSQIQQIIDGAREKNIILFAGKSYDDVNLIINKRLTLISNINTVLKSNSTKPALLIKFGSSYTTINGFNIQSNANAVEVDGADYITILNNDISSDAVGILVQNANYINITANNVVKNSKCGVDFISTSNSHIYNNNITDNMNGIQLTGSNNIYIYNNVISANKVDGISILGDMGSNLCENVYITYNTVTKNRVNGINVDNAGDNIKIASNELSSNADSGLLINSIGSNSVQSNVITSNGANGLKFSQSYVQKDNHDVSYNVIYNNFHKDVDAKDTYYQENGQRLNLGDNWYGDWGFVCPKISTNNLLFKVSQVGKNQFRAVFYDSNGNVASLLPDRILTYNSGGQTLSITVKGGIATFNVDAADGDLVSAVVDRSVRDNTFDASIKNTAEVINGKSPSYNYPAIHYDSNYVMNSGGDGNGNGDGNGDGGNSQSGEFLGNSSSGKNLKPANSHSNSISTASNYQTSSTSQAQSSSSTIGDSGNQQVQSESVVKQIIIDEDDFYKLTGISFIFAIMILTIGFYYREDIKEMNSKR